MIIPITPLFVSLSVFRPISTQIIRPNKGCDHFESILKFVNALKIEKGLSKFELVRNGKNTVFHELENNI